MGIGDDCRSGDVVIGAQPYSGFGCMSRPSGCGSRCGSRQPGMPAALWRQRHGVAGGASSAGLVSVTRDPRARLRAHL